MFGGWKISKESLIKNIKEIVVWLLIAGVLLNGVSYLRQPKIDEKTLPYLSLESTLGKSIDFQEYKGKPLVIHFWATWCPTCKLEISNINSLAKSYNVVTVAVNSGTNQKINQFLMERNADFDVINDTNGEFAKKLNVEVFPTTFFYDSKGELAFVEVGYTTTVGLEGRMQWLSK